MGLFGVGAETRFAWDVGILVGVDGEVEVVEGRGVAVLLLELFWTRGALELIARAVMGLRSWRGTWLDGAACWRDFKACQGLHLRYDMVGRGGMMSSWRL